MAASPLSVQTVAAVLRRSGFERSDFHHRDVNRHTASTGFRVWRTLSQPDPGTPAVAVAHFDAGQHGDRLSSDEARALWATHRAGAKRKLQSYTTVLRIAGYGVGLRFDAEDPYIVVTARTDGD